MADILPARTQVTASRSVPVRLDVPLLDEYLTFVAGRCRPNTVLATAYDLKVFFTVVGKAPRDVVARAGGVGADGAAAVVERVGAVRLAAGPCDATVNPVPRGLPIRRERHRPVRECRW